MSEEQPASSTAPSGGDNYANPTPAYDTAGIAEGRGKEAPMSPEIEAGYTENAVQPAADAPATGSDEQVSENQHGEEDDEAVAGEKDCEYEDRPLKASKIVARLESADQLDQLFDARRRSSAVALQQDG